MKFLSSVDSWSTIFEWASVGLVALTFVAGAGTVITSRIINSRQSKAILDLTKDANDSKAAQQRVETELEKQREKTELAKQATLNLERLVKEPRRIDRKKGDDILDWGQRGSVAILHLAIGDEPGNLANALAEILFAHGWTIASNNSAVATGSGPSPGIVIRMHGDKPGTIVVGKWEDAPEPAKTLHRLLVEALTNNPRVETRVSDDVPEGPISVFIALKY